MRVFFAFLLIVLISSCRKNTDGAAEVFTLDTAILRTGLSEPLQSVWFTSENTGYVGTNSGRIYKTTDGASSWDLQTSTVNNPIRSLFFLDAQNGFAAGGENSCGGSPCTPPGGFILRTTNGGNTWTRVFTPTTLNELSSIYFVNSTLGFCVGDNLILKTTDGGATWSEYRINNLGGKMSKVRFKDSQTGWIACLFDRIIKTEDGGITWTVTQPLSGNGYGYYSIVESEGSLFASGQGKMIKSTNSGDSWTQLQDSPYDIFATHFVNKEKGFAFGRGNYSGGDFGYSYGSIYYTVDGGNTWNGTASVKGVTTIVDVSFPTTQVAYAISSNSVIRINLD